MYEQHKKLSLILTLGIILLAGLHQLLFAVLLMLNVLTYVPGFGSIFVVILLLLVVVLIAWIWTIPGGLLEVISGVILLPLVLFSSWSLAFKIPYALFSCVFITGGVVNLIIVEK